MDMDFSLWIHIAIALFSSLLSAFAGYYFSQRKYTYEKLFDIRLAHIQELYSRVVTLEDILNKYTITTGSMMGDKYTEEKNEEINKVMGQFFELRSLFRKTEISLEEKTAQTVSSFIDASISVLSKLKVSFSSSIRGDHETAYNFWEKAHTELESHFRETKNALKSEFRKSIRNNDPFY